MKKKKIIIGVVIIIILAIGLIRIDTIKFYLSRGYFILENRNDITKLLTNYYNSGETGENSKSNWLKLTPDAYKRKPKKSDLHIPKNEDHAFLDNILKTIFPDGLDSLSDEEKSIEIMRYVVTSLKLKNNAGSATKLIKEGYAICGGMSYVFSTLCRKIGIPTRSVNLYYDSWQGGHSLNEVFYDGQWHLFDSTFGIFFYSRSRYDRKGYVISLTELISSPSKWIPFKVASEIWLGEYNEKVRAFDVTKLTEDDPLSKKHYSWIIESGDSIANLYRKMAESTFPVAYGQNNIVSFPVDANLLEKKNKWFGRANNKLIYNDYEDSTNYIYKHRFSGNIWAYISNTSSFPSFDTWLIKVPKNSLVSIEYYSVKANPPQLKLIPLRAAQLINTKYENKKVTFTMRINESEGIVSIHCPDGYFPIDAMHIYRDK